MEHRGKSRTALREVVVGALRVKAYDVAMIVQVTPLGTPFANEIIKVKLSHELRL